ncbi:MAG TPA: serine/threonine-protein kinase [Ktedonobacteraceae bacterium]|nr:serine/threonine-protein kinase [Ktedonobacteraceae bacterium]
MIDRIGQQFGHYRLLSLVGRGGFADVYLGEHVHLKTQAAIKVLHTALDQDDIEQFRSEALTIAHLDHPHIVRILDFGIQQQVPFLVMDYAFGTLRKLHPKGSQLPLPAIVSYVKQIASALQYAHDKRLVHRDIKPENMLLNRNQKVMLSDFGIAVMAQTTRSSLIQRVAGTAAYMAPEQFQGKARPASDQYALAVVIYEWLCGSRPFQGTFTEVASQHMFSPSPPLRERLPTIPSSIEQVVQIALAKDPAQRFASVWEFATTLEQVSAPYITNQQAQPTGELTEPFSSASSTYVPIMRQPTLISAPESLSSTPRSMSDTADITPVDNITTRKEKRPVSRRSLLVGIALAGLAGAGVTAGALTWLPSLKPNFNFSFTSHFDENQSSTPTPNPTPASDPTATTNPTATPNPAQTPMPGTVGTTLYVYGGHNNSVESAAWSHDSKRIATASDDRTVQVWDAGTGANPFTYSGHTDIVAAVAWSPDSTRIASCSNDKTVRIWDAINGGHVLIYKGHSNAVADVAWSPDGTRIASCSKDTTVQVWSPTSGTLSYTFTGHSAKVWSLSWSPDSKRIATSSTDTTVKVWDASSGRIFFTCTGHSGVVSTVAWSPDGKLLATCGADHTVQVWNADDGLHLYTYSGHHDNVWSLCWSPNSQRIASCSADHTVQVWDATTGGNAYTYQGHNQFYFVAWSPDGTRIVSGGTDTAVQVWQAI